MSLFLGPGKSAVDSTREMLAALRFKATGEREASASSRIMRPQGVALPIMNFSAKVRVMNDRIEEIALAVAPVAPTPFRCRNTETFLSGKPATFESIAAAVAILLSECKPRTSPHRATAEYRKAVLPVLLRRTLGKAIDRAQTRLRATVARAGGSAARSYALWGRTSRWPGRAVSTLT